MHTRFLRVFFPTVLVTVLATLFASDLPAQATLAASPYGSGTDGAFSPTVDVTIDTNIKACLEYKSFFVPAGVTVTVVGNRPLYVKVQGACTIDGKIVSSGAVGMPSKLNTPGGAGGTGGAGGGTGGAGGARAAAPFDGTGGDGTGLRPGIGGKDAGPVPGTFLDPVGGGGGGGNATAGLRGGPPNGTKKTPDMSGDGGKAGVSRAGSGGGGGGGDIDSKSVGGDNDGGGGGGGGGGWLTFAAPGITISGSIQCDGGAGGKSDGNGGGGGGGAGGCIDLISPAITSTGSLSAIGGTAGPATQANCGCSPGGDGGLGCINIYGLISGTGSANPKPNVHTVDLVVNRSCPMSVAVQAATATDRFLTGVGVVPLTPPWNSPWGPVCTIDDVFILTLFANTVPGLKNSNGTGAGTLELSDPNLKLGPQDVELLMQSITVNASNTITGVSNCLKIVVKL